MERLLANISGQVRRATFNGRDYLIAPATSITPGVLTGSRGALYYPPDEIGKDVASWNGMPIVARHPLDGDVPVSARNPGVLERQGIGTVFETAVANGKLQLELWFDIDATRRVDDRILRAIEAGRPVELSTGLYVDAVDAPQGAVHNGTDRDGQSYERPYSHIARNYRPDHIAILMDEKGACSVADGCGVLVNKDGDPDCPT